jgi:hypothetical protein
VKTVAGWLFIIWDAVIFILCLSIILAGKDCNPYLNNWIITDNLINLFNNIFLLVENFLEKKWNLTFGNMIIDKILIEDIQ